VTKKKGRTRPATYSLLVERKLILGRGKGGIEGSRGMGGQAYTKRLSRLLTLFSQGKEERGKKKGKKKRKGEHKVSRRFVRGDFQFHFYEKEVVQTPQRGKKGGERKKRGILAYYLLRGRKAK